MQAQHIVALSRSIMLPRRALIIGGFLFAALPSEPAAAGEPVAVVEQIAAPSTGLQFMDFVEVGRLIKLRAGETMSLGYFGSCIQEQIVGGSVQIGTNQSNVDGGEVQRQQVECDGGRLQLDASSNDSSGVLILRSIEPATTTASGGDGALPAAELTLFHTQPIIGISIPNSLLRIERLDASEPRLEMRIEARYLDLATTANALTPGGLYKAEAVGHSITFRVDPKAAAGGGPVIGRLLYL
ncbi:MAG TPA: hypothetical protein VMT98_10520 [Verrucomicrobiae bacterium]|nr:hypothetical protein [Verrucomicrobiae bacterium]